MSSKEFWTDYYYELEKWTPSKGRIGQFSHKTFARVCSAYNVSYIVEELAETDYDPYSDDTKLNKFLAWAEDRIYHEFNNDG